VKNDVQKIALAIPLIRFFCTCFSPFHSSLQSAFDTMSELTERSKCVFQAKLAEQAERYDGTTTITFRFICVYKLFTHLRVCIYLCSIGTIRSGRFVPSFSRLNMLRLVAFIRAKKLTPRSHNTINNTHLIRILQR